MYKIFVLHNLILLPNALFTNHLWKNERIQFLFYRRLQLSCWKKENCLLIHHFPRDDFKLLDRHKYDKGAAVDKQTYEKKIGSLTYQITIVYNGRIVQCWNDALRGNQHSITNTLRRYEHSVADYAARATNIALQINAKF